MAGCVSRPSLPRQALPRAMPMMFHPFRRGPQTGNIASLYGTIVALARGAEGAATTDGAGQG